MKLPQGFLVIACRGVDFPAVDWVVQAGGCLVPSWRLHSFTDSKADCPDTVDSYIHRA